MRVDRSKALQVDAGRTYFFCSEGCLHTFKADPERYLHDAAGHEHQPEHAHAH
jgi:YHS domain-containing protein